MAKPNLLLVDGDARTRRVLEVSLRKAGFLVATADDGQEAIDKVNAAPPDLVISDTQLPNVDGFVLCKHIKSHPQLAAIPFIFLTKQRSIEDKIRGLELGVEEYLTKPIFVKEIVIRIKILLQRRQRENLTDRDGRTTFSGDLSDMAVVDLIQTLELGNKSGIIHFVGDDRRGAIFFRDGKIIDAELGRLQGERAVYRLLLWSDGKFNVEFRTIRRKDVVAQSNQALMMEGMRRVDEWGRLLEQLPPLETVFEVDYAELANRLGEIPDEMNSVIRLFDGRRTLLQVVDDCAAGDLEALEIISKLFFEGLIFEVAQPESGDPGPLRPWSGAAAGVGGGQGEAFATALQAEAEPEPAAEEPADDDQRRKRRSTERGVQVVSPPDDPHAVRKGGAFNPSPTPQDPAGPPVEEVNSELPAALLSEVPPATPESVMTRLPKAPTAPGPSVKPLGEPLGFSAEPAEALDPAEEPDQAAEPDQARSPDQSWSPAAEQAPLEPPAEQQPPVVMPPVVEPSAEPSPPAAVEQPPVVVPPVVEPMPAVEPPPAVVEPTPAEQPPAEQPPADQQPPSSFADALHAEAGVGTADAPGGAMPIAFEPPPKPPIVETTAAEPPSVEPTAPPPAAEEPAPEEPAPPPATEELAPPPATEEPTAVEPALEPEAPKKQTKPLLVEPPASQLAPPKPPAEAVEPQREASGVIEVASNKPSREGEVDDWLAGQQPRAGGDVIPFPSKAEAKEGDVDRAAGDAAARGGHEDPSAASIDGSDEAFFESEVQPDPYEIDDFEYEPSGGRGRIILFGALGMLAVVAAGVIYHYKTSPYTGTGDPALAIKERPRQVGGGAKVGGGARVDAAVAVADGAASSADAGVARIEADAAPAPDVTVAIRVADAAVAEVPDAAAPSGEYAKLVGEAKALESKGRRGRAYRLYAKALKADPNGWEALEALSLKALDRGQMAKANKLATQALAGNAEAPRAPLVNGMWLIERGKKAAAKEAFTTYLARCPRCRHAKEIAAYLKTL